MLSTIAQDILYYNCKIQLRNTQGLLLWKYLIVTQDFNFKAIVSQYWGLLLRMYFIMVTGITALEVPHYGSGFEPQVAAAGSIPKLTGAQPTKYQDNIHLPQLFNDIIRPGF